MIHTPGIFVQRIVQGMNYRKPIEQRTVRKRGIMPGRVNNWPNAPAREMRDGFYVNLGIGIPTLVGNYIPAGMQVLLQSENGMLGMGPFPYEGEEDADLINAGKQTITELPISSYFSSADSFGMIRGGHINLSVLGAWKCQSAGSGQLDVPGQGGQGHGRRHDLVAGVRRVIVLMEHLWRRRLAQVQARLRAAAHRRRRGRHADHRPGRVQPQGPAFGI